MIRSSLPSGRGYAIGEASMTADVKSSFVALSASGTGSDPSAPNA